MKKADLFSDEAKNPEPVAEPTKEKTKKPTKEKVKKTEEVEAQDMPTTIHYSIPRVNADPNKGLTDEQIQERIEHGLVNTAPKKYSKTYKSIFVDNICTFFNLLCLLCALALLLARAPITQFTFVLIFLCNISVSIFQEIRAKKKIDKLSILSSPTAKVVRNGEKIEIPVNELVVDDVILLSAGQQVPADCITIEGNAEFNESLLTGESVPIKKQPGDELFAGSFVASGQIAARVDKVADNTYISKLTAKAKKYKKPNSEIMNSITLFIKIIGLAIVPIAILMFFTHLLFCGFCCSRSRESNCHSWHTVLHIFS